MQRTYRYRIYPTAKQEEELTNWLDTCRWLYNHSLEERKIAYDYAKARLNYYDQANALKIAKQSSDMGWLKQVHSQVLQDVLKRLDKAFKNFFRRVKNGEKPGYPRFKSRDRFNSFTFPQSGYGISEDGKKLELSKIGAIKLKQHRPIPENGTVKTCSIKRDGKHWFVTFVVDLLAIARPTKRHIETAIGVDLGLNAIATLSSGEKIENPRWLRASEKKLAREQRKLSRKKKGSGNRKRQKTIVATTHRKVRNQRMNSHHKLSKELVDNYDLIVFEDLTIKNMVKNKHLAKSISDAGWNQLVSFATYKAEEAGKNVVSIDPKGTSQLCSSCGAEVKKSLAVRTHRCLECGLVMDRDENAALNILNRGLEKVGQGLPECTPVEILSRESWKQEATQLVGW